MFIRDRVVEKGTSNPVPDGTSVEIRLESTNALLATVTTTNGFFSWQDNGSPGAVRTVCVYNGATKVHTTRSVGPADTVQLGELQDALNFFVGGIVTGVRSTMAVTPAVSGFTVNVASGAVASRGMIHSQYTSSVPLTFVPVAPYNTVVNTYGIYVEFYGRDSATPGKTQLIQYNQSIGNEPAAATGVWRVELARVRIDPIATSLAPSDITVTAGPSDRHFHNIQDINSYLSNIIGIFRVVLGGYPSGVISGFRNSLQTTQVSGQLKTSTATGGGIVSRADTAIMVDSATGAVETAIPVSGTAGRARIDTIVLEVAPATGYDLRTTPVIVRVPGVIGYEGGVGGTAPVAPTLQQDATKFQIPLADVLVNNTAITSVTDRRIITGGGGTGGGGGGTGGVYWKDVNFAATGNISSGSRLLAAPSTTLPAGTYFIECHCNLTVRNSGNNGTVKLYFDGNAAPVAPDDSARIFLSVGGVPRTIQLSGRKTLVLATPTAVTLNARLQYDSPDTTDVRDGVAYFTAQRL